MSTFDRYAGSVHQLIRFAEVRALFKWHVSRWRRKKALIHANKAKAEEALKPSARQKKVPPEWPLRRVGIGENSRLIQVPPELQRKVEKREALTQGSLLTRLTRKPLKDLTPSERFTLLAQIHDACHADHHLGPTDLRAYERGKGHYLAGVMGLESSLPEGRRLTTSEATRLNDVLAFVLVRIEAKFDAAMRDDNGELLVDVVSRVRRNLNLPSTQTRLAQSKVGSEKLEPNPRMAIFDGQSDTSKKSQKKPKRRQLNDHGKKCIKEFKAYKRRGDRQTMRYVVKEYAAEHPKVKESSLYKMLSDNSDQWKQ